MAGLNDDGSGGGYSCPLLLPLLLLWLQRKVNELENEGNSFEHFVNGKID